MASLDDAHRIGRRLIDFLQESESTCSPVDATAGIAIALGGMIASMDELGLSKPGRSGAMLEHFLKLAEQSALEGLGA